MQVLGLWHSPWACGIRHNPLPCHFRLLVPWRSPQAHNAVFKQLHRTWSKVPLFFPQPLPHEFREVQLLFHQYKKAEPEEKNHPSLYRVILILSLSRNTLKVVLLSHREAIAPLFLRLRVAWIKRADIVVFSSCYLYSEYSPKFNPIIIIHHVSFNCLIFYFSRFHLQL